MNQELYNSITGSVAGQFLAFKDHFDSLLSVEDADLAPLMDCLKLRNGKMLRPILVLLIGRYYGFPTDRLYNVAASIELLHTATLIHDDVVDNSMLRRGMASFNAVFDNKMSILFGDYVVSMSLGEMSRSGMIHNVEYLSQLSKTLSSGEITQLNVRTKDVLSEDSYFDIISRKTACLFSAAGHIAAYTCGAPSCEVDMFCEFGRLVGLCFQIKDDIFDYFPSAATGKPSGNDLKEGKFTLPAIYALNHSDKDWTSTIRDVRNCMATPQQMRLVTDYSIEHGGIEYANGYMQRLSSQAISLLPAGMPQELRTAFTDYMSLIINRDR